MADGRQRSFLSLVITLALRQILPGEINLWARKNLRLGLDAIFAGARDLTNISSRNEPSRGTLPSRWRRDPVVDCECCRPGDRSSCDLTLKVNIIRDTSNCHCVGLWCRSTLDPDRDCPRVANTRL